MRCSTRYFDTGMGRFISRDPLGFVDGFGLYNGYFAEWMILEPTGSARKTKRKTKSQAKEKAKPNIRVEHSSKNDTEWVTEYKKGECKECIAVIFIGAPNKGTFVSEALERSIFRFGAGLLAAKYDEKGYSTETREGTSTDMLQEINRACVARVSFIGHGGLHMKDPAIQLKGGFLEPYHIKEAQKDGFNPNPCFTGGALVSCNSGAVDRNGKSLEDLFGNDFTTDEFIDPFEMSGLIYGWTPPDPPPCCSGKGK